MTNDPIRCAYCTGLANRFQRETAADSIRHHSPTAWLPVCLRHVEIIDDDRQTQQTHYRLPHPGGYPRSDHRPDLVDEQSVTIELVE